MISPIFKNEEVNQLFALRSRTTNCKDNFKQKYKNDDLLCGLCHQEKEDQPHLLKCDVLSRKLQTTQVSRNNAEYDDIFSEDINKQKEISTIYLQLFKLKSDIEANNSQPAYSILHSSSGKLR